MMVALRTHLRMLRGARTPRRFAVPVHVAMMALSLAASNGALVPRRVQEAMWAYDAWRVHLLADGRIRTLDILPDGFVLASGVLLVPWLILLHGRLADADRSRWWFLMLLVPAVGPWGMLLVLMSPGTPGPNRFGPDPRAAAFG